ncbi:unnamed protein product [Meganyctiphanes norvegica]|uniref:Iodothyronine deiodinase n=1 Tax=Meganyctiphanes norvegica TaxID=48144 RepID=A0AAV2SA45_MEGNR
MAYLENYRKLSEDFSVLADFVVVYIAEAHPSDGWAINGNVQLPNHKSMGERIFATQKMLSMRPQYCPVLMDLMHNECQTAFAAMPQRLYIVQDGVIVYKGAQGPTGYKINEVQDWLTSYQK